MKHFLLITTLIISITIINSTILIIQPAINGFPNNSIPYLFANFGIIHYNKPMSYSLYYTPYTLCDNPQQINLKQFTSPTYVLLKQGNCSYTKKALTVQNLGGSGIIIGSKDIQYTTSNVLISDDGAGRKIKITTLFISLDHVDKLSKLNNVQIKVNYQLPLNNISSLNLFISATGRQNYVFLRNFREYYNKLSNQIRLNIIYHTFSCQSCDQTDCILYKTCCIFDIDNYQSGMGYYILLQQFRQYKLFKYFSNNSNIDKWFQYMNQFDQKCDNDWINSQLCSKSIYQKFGINKLLDLDTRTIIEQWRMLQTKTGIISFPDISVNGFRHVQILSAESAFSMICQSLSGSIPACNPQQQQQTTDNGRGGIITSVIICSILLIIAGIYCYKKLIQRQITNDMTSKVNQLVAKYAAKVSEQKKKRRDKLMERMTEEL